MSFKDKLKELLANWFAWVLLLLVGVILYIIKLTTKVRDLKAKVNNLVFKQDMQKDLEKAKELNDAANKSESDYNATRDAYLNQHPNKDTSK